ACTSVSRRSSAVNRRASMSRRMGPSRSRGCSQGRTTSSPARGQATVTDAAGRFALPFDAQPPLMLVLEAPDILLAVKGMGLLKGSEEAARAMEGLRFWRAVALHDGPGKRTVATREDAIRPVLRPRRHRDRAQAPEPRPLEADDDRLVNRLVNAVQRVVAARCSCTITWRRWTSSSRRKRQ